MAEKEGSGVARGAQHTVHVLPHAPYVIARFLAPALERVAPDAESTQLVVITADDDTALAVAEVARTINDRSTAPVVPLTGAARSARVLGGRALPAIAASPATLVALLKASAVKLGEVRTVVVAWADELFAAREDEALEVVLAEVPKEAARIVVTTRATPEIEALVERHLRRARRVGGSDATTEAVGGHAVRYVVTASATRGAALRRLLDEVDPPSALVVTRDGRSEQEVRDTLTMLGYADDDPNVRVVRGDQGAPDAEADADADAEGGDGEGGDARGPEAALVVLYDLPTTAAELTQSVTGAAQVVALVTPRQLPTLRSLTSGMVEPLEISPAAAKARGRDERLRAAIRAELQGAFPAREVIALEPLLAEFDGLEIAAAALRILERERTEARTRRMEAERAVSLAAAGAAATRAPETDFTRLFMSIGERDGVRPSDLVGAIANEAGITSDKIGRIDVRESHSVAEVASSVAETVLEKINGVTVRGRRITARVDERPARPREGAREGGRFGARSGGRGGPREGGGERGGSRDREGGRGGFRDRERAPRGGGGGRFSRDEGGARERRFSRDEGERPRTRRGADEGSRGGRGSFRDRGDEGRIPRATHEREEWTERADRVRNARRPRRGEE